MKKVYFLVAAAMFLFSGCAFVNAPLIGGIVTNTTSPLTATSNNICEKTGNAKCTSILGIVAYGDCSIETAKKNGGLSEVSSVDVKAFSVLGFYASYETIVCGK